MPAGPVVDSASSRTVNVQMPTGVYQMCTKTCTTNSLTIDWDHQLIWIHDQKLIHIKHQPSETAVIVNMYRTEDHNQWWTPSILFALLQVICWEGLPALINFCHSFLSSAIFFSATYFPFIRSLSRRILLLTHVAFTLILPSIISCSNDSCLSTWPNYTRLHFPTVSNIVLASFTLCRTSSLYAVMHMHDSVIYVFAHTKSAFRE